jgi:hypothetical protein
MGCCHRFDPPSPLKKGELEIQVGFGTLLSSVVQADVRLSDVHFLRILHHE